MGIKTEILLKQSTPWVRFEVRIHKFTRTKKAFLGVTAYIWEFDKEVHVGTVNVNNMTKGQRVAAAMGACELFESRYLGGPTNEPWPSRYGLRAEAAERMGT